MDNAIQRELSKIYRELAQLRERIDRSYGGVIGNVTVIENAISQAEFLALAIDAELPNERRFVPGWGLSGVDGGAGGDYTLSANTDTLDARYTRLDRIVRMGATWATYEKSATGLTAALAASVSGDTVWCPPATYTGNFTVPSGVTLRGASQDECIINGQVTLSNLSAFYSFSIVAVYNDAVSYWGVHGPDNGHAAYIREIRILLEQQGSGATYGIYSPSPNTLYIKDCFVQCLGSNGFALWCDNDIRSGAALVVTDLLDSDNPVTADLLYTQIETVPPATPYLETKMQWRIALAAQDAAYSYCYVKFSSFVQSDRCNPTDYPIRTSVTISLNNATAGQGQYLNASGTWVNAPSSFTLGLYDIMRNCGSQEMPVSGIYLRLKRQILPVNFVVLLEARIGGTGFEGIGVLNMGWSELRYEEGLHVEDTYLYGSQQDIYLESSIAWMQGNTYRQDFITLTNSDIIPEPGDRAAWDVDNYPSDHASDISAAALQRHLPLPGASGGLVQSDGTDWQRVDGLAHSETTSRDAAASHPASAIQEAVKPGWIMQSNSGTGALEASALRSWSLSGIDDTAVTLIEDGDYDLARVGVFLYTVYAVTGTDTSSGLVTIDNNTSWVLYNDGTDALTLAVAADGSMTLQRTSGADTFDVVIAGIWQ